MPVWGFQWLNWDDGAYVLENPLVGNFTWDRIVDNFTSFTIGAYHPFTTISYCFDYLIGGQDPSVYHALNLFLHLFNIYLVFQFVKLFSNKHRALFVAFVFALHPMVIEPVAWITGRKDLLVTLFLLLGLNDYLKNEGKSSTWLYLYFLFALLSKGTAVVFPVLLMLIDYYNGWNSGIRHSIKSKISLFVGSFIFGIIAKIGQQSADAMESIIDIDFVTSLFIGAHNYLEYLIKLFLPLDLSPFNPYPKRVGDKVPIQYIVSLFLLITLVVIWWKKLRHYKEFNFAFGFYSVSIFLLLQILPFGQAMFSDRFFYFPMIGLLFGISSLLDYIRNYQGNRVFYGATLLIGLMLFTGSKNQLSVWENNEKLWGKVIEVYPDDEKAYNNLSFHLGQKGEWAEALKSMRKYQKFTNKPAAASNNIGLLHLRMNRRDSAMYYFSKALSQNPTEVTALENRALMFIENSQLEKAYYDLQNLKKVDELNPVRFYGEGLILLEVQQPERAISKLDSAEILGCKLPPLNYFLALNYYQLKNHQKAEYYIRRTIDAGEESERVYWLSAQNNYFLGDFNSAKSDVQKAEELGFEVDPRFKKLLIK